MKSLGALLHSHPSNNDLSTLMWIVLSWFWFHVPNQHNYLLVSDSISEIVIVASDDGWSANAVPPLMSADVGLVGSVTASKLCSMLFRSYFICLCE